MTGSRTDGVALLQRATQSQTPEAAVDAGVRFATLEQVLATLVTAPRSGRPRLVRPARVRRVSEWRGLRAP